ncbi:MAG: hypothetical protein J6A28_01885 [Clostridia bacterium]|nr:hypothetical protein [Clostridia bacterium]
MAAKKEDSRQIKIDLPENKQQEEKEQPEKEVISTFPNAKFKNDAGEEISVENGYSDADIRELKQLEEDDEQSSL